MTDWSALGGLKVLEMNERHSSAVSEVLNGSLKWVNWNISFRWVGFKKKEPIHQNRATDNLQDLFSAECFAW